MYKTLGWRTFLTAENLPRNFEVGEETVFPQFRGNKYGIFDRGRCGNDILLDNLVQNSENQTTRSVVFVQGMCFAVIPYSSNYYIFDSHSPDNLGQSIENGYSVLLKFVTTEHVLNFITATYLINNHLQNFYENQFAFLPELKRSTKKRVLRRLRQRYRNIFYRDNELHWMHCPNI